MEYIIMIKEKCNELIQQAHLTKEIEKIENLQKIINELDNGVFFRNDRAKVFSILINLDIEVLLAAEICEYFYADKLVQGKLKYIDLNGNEHFYDALLNPDKEIYYRTEYGAIFKKLKDADQFYILKNGEWELDWDIQRKFYDAGYDYQVIDYITEDDCLRR